MSFWSLGCFLFKLDSILYLHFISFSIQVFRSFFLFFYLFSVACQSVQHDGPLYFLLVIIVLDSSNGSSWGHRLIVGACSPSSISEKWSLIRHSNRQLSSLRSRWKLKRRRESRQHLRRRNNFLFCGLRLLKRKHLFVILEIPIVVVRTRQFFSKDWQNSKKHIWWLFFVDLHEFL